MLSFKEAGHLESARHGLRRATVSEAYGYYCEHLDGSEAHKADAQAASEEADQLMRDMA
ncbi:hypothetical protein M2352_004852 [Azospirillum fermentarium]|uniref:hypothetical protein n=1 Tax=Azospirillum fermentarium TaxID=1233114 RepID=UPI002227279E|nr:hypothetical protein [Azospirillum fermentarium]MCW2249192.1 hypothetical protein [Azospirillum fermentarium]